MDVPRYSIAVGITLIRTGPVPLSVLSVNLGRPDANENGCMVPNASLLGLQSRARTWRSWSETYFVMAMLTIPGFIRLFPNAGAESSNAEIKRLWVSPTARGFGLAYRLMEEAETMARKLSISTLRRDTNRSLAAALNLYRRLGWTEIERFNDDPYADYFFEKTIA
ncbi:GNAT family N-acetyltransferase [Sphingomonas koreensis]|nr:GNAT family N-acetyltransferase [Sphingomonas koreensis]